MIDLKLKFRYPVYLVGGYVRDSIIGVPSKDIDLVTVCPSFEKMIDAIKEVGGEIFLEKPEYFTARCKIPQIGAVDIAMARKDGDYSDGRRPDSVSLADSIEDDLSRRDATINAIAYDLANASFIDPFDGRGDIERRLVRAVGKADDRIREDYLRALRYLRFAITKKFHLDVEIQELLTMPHVFWGIQGLSEDRIREELYKCFKFSTRETIIWLGEYAGLANVLFERNLWLKPTNEK